METLYRLTPHEQDVLSNLDQSDVIATGPWRKGECSLPHRAVIRDLGNNQYVVHNQIIGDGELGMAHYAVGSYVSDRDPVDRLEMALVEFNRRIRVHHNLPIYTRK